MGRGAETDHRPAREEVLVDPFHLIVRQRPEAGEHEDQVGGPQGFESGYVRLLVRVDDPGLRIDGEEDGAVEAVAERQDRGELGQCLFGPILLVAGDQDDADAVAGSSYPFVHQPSISRLRGDGSDGHGAEQPEQGDGGKTHRDLLIQR